MVRRVLGGAAALLAVIAGIVLTLSAEHHEAVTLPALTGPYSVGRAAFDWVDQSRTEELAPETRSKRELTVWIWYPASIDKSATAAEYLPRPWRVALARRQGPLMTNFMMHDTSLVQSHGFDNADVAPGQRTYPVILMKPGIGALALYYTTLAEDLASDGYIVVASDSTYSTFLVAFHDGRVAYRRRAGNAGEAAPISEQNRAANRVISAWVADDRFVLDRLVQLNRSDSFGKFRGRLNLHAIGVMGHSFGGRILPSGLAVHGRHRHRWHTFRRSRTERHAPAVHVSYERPLQRNRFGKARSHAKDSEHLRTVAAKPVADDVA